jgi:signal transduction histidine kinase
MKKKPFPNPNIRLSTFPETYKVPKIIVWMIARQWWAIILATVLLVSFEAYDFSHNQDLLIYFIETIIFLILLWVIGLLLSSLSKGIRNQDRIIRILDAKHKLSLELSGYHDWDVLVNHIARFPSTFAPVKQSCLFVSNFISNQFELAAEWTRSGEDAVDLCTGGSCQECIKKGQTPELSFFPSDPESISSGLVSQDQKYCLAIKDDVRLLGILQFTLEPGATLTYAQDDIFKNISDDLAVALKAGQDREVLQEMLNSETALAERRSVSHYLHDHLGQSLGFLHIKMDQLLTGKESLSLEKVLVDLELMRDAADESFEIVRGVLETMRPETTRTLTNLLLEYARKLSQRANFQLDFKTKGKPVLLPEEAQNAVFYAFEELLSNIEKHARATKVIIKAEWSPADLNLTISDNGVGFDPQLVNPNEHFGLDILNERMANVMGRVSLLSSERSGTVVKILVPVPSRGQLGAGS